MVKAFNYSKEKIGEFTSTPTGEKTDRGDA
jgi:hypothetical protein